MTPTQHHLSRVASIVASAFVLACGGTGAPGGDGGTTASGRPGPDLSMFPACVPDGQVEPPHMDIAGAIYSVPVPAELEPFASYSVEDVSLCRLGSGIELGYSLPALLVGKKTRVAFAGTYDSANGTYELSSADGTASCELAGEAWSCLEHFTGIEVDLEEVAEEAEDLSQQEAAARLDVAEQFSGDPIGILDFTLP